mgnify:CR=1 FL=1
MFIEIKDIKKHYGEGESRMEVLNGVNIEIEKGEICVLLGPSGSGKSTLLNILGGLDKISQGTYFYNDINVGAMNNKELNRFRKEHISFIFQNYALMNFYTVYENTEVPLIARGIRKKERKSMVEKALTDVGIIDLAKKTPSEISGGEKQRCAIARALVADNDIILADEPTGSLDKTNGKNIMDIFDKLKEQHKTIILVTHDEFISGYADRIVRIEDGEITEK